MRHYAKFELPRGLRSKLLTALQHSPTYVPLSHVGWRQSLLTDLLGPQTANATTKTLLACISKAVGQPFKVEDFSAVLHWGSGEEVPRHTDNLARTCFLVPLRSAKTLEFQENWERCRLQGKSLIRFSDFEDHGLDNPNRSHFCLLTLSRDRV